MEPKEGCCRRAVFFLKCSFEIEMYAIFVVSLTLRCGTVWINNCQPAFIQAPWGGVKQSGFGRELNAGACKVNALKEKSYKWGMGQVRIVR
jgi:hypothetical protein